MGNRQGKARGNTEQQQEGELQDTEKANNKGGTSITLLQQLSGTLECQLTIPKSSSELPLWNSNLLGRENPVVKVSLPCAIVKAVSKEDVVKCMQFAVKHRIKVSARGLGHQYAGACVPPGGILLDLSNLTSFRVLAEERTAYVQPGVTGGQLTAALAPHGLHFPIGHCSSVPMSGFILGGGNGWGCRLYGASADNVEAYEVVCASEDGCRLTWVDANSNADLFWGLGGAGAFLGVVTEIKLRLHPLPPQLPMITAIYPLDVLKDALKFYSQWSTSSPAAAETCLILSSSPVEPSQRVVVLTATGFCSADDPDIQSTFEQVRGFMPESRAMLEDKVVPYIEAMQQVDHVFNITDHCMSSHLMYVQPSALQEDVLAANLQQSMEQLTSPRSLILVVTGMPTSTANNAVSFRGGLIIGPYAFWKTPPANADPNEDEKHVKWMMRVRDAAAPFVIGHYINEVMLSPANQVEGLTTADCYDTDKFKRLQQLKSQTDPYGLLRAL